MAGVFLGLLILGTVLLAWWYESRRHDRRLRPLRIGVHVNGTRGEATVTRLIAGVLREAGLHTVADKATGTLAAFLGAGEGTAETEAIVVECMALGSESKTGETSREICRSLLSTWPLRGVLVTAERNPKLLAIIREVARGRGSPVVVASAESVADQDLRGLDHVSVKEFLAIGLTVAELLGIPRHIALAGMANAAPDPVLVVRS